MKKTHEKNIMKTKWTKLETRWWRNIWQHHRHIECWVWPQNMDHWRCFLANTSGWYYSIEGNRALKDKRKGQWNQFYFQKKQKISKQKSQTISKNLKISQNFSNVVSQTWFCETGFFIAYFSGPQKISKNLKKSQNLSDLQEKNKKQEKKQNKTKQTNANLQKPWTISAILALFPQAVKCYFLHCTLLQPDSV